MTEMLIDVVDGIVETLVFEGDQAFIRYRQDVDPVLEANKAAQNDGSNGYSPTKEWQRVASIPMGLVLQWRQEGIDVFDPNAMPAILRKLNSPDYRHLRTNHSVL